LWALGEVSRLAASSHPGDRDRAVELAARYQIVTSVSGAVVLENAGQYRETGLTQVNPASSARGVPEPASWGLLIFALMVLWDLQRRTRLTRRRSAADCIPTGTVGTSDQ